MTIEYCLSICRSKGLPFSGLEWSFECHCGFMPEEGFEWAWPDKCADRCSGNINQVCGGSNALSIWTTPPDYLNGFCVYDTRERVLQGRLSANDPDMTHDICRDFCKGKDSDLFSL